MRIIFKPVLVAASIAAMFTAASIAPALAEIMKPGNYPSRPITIIMCYGKAGGSAQSIQTTSSWTLRQTGSFESFWVR